MFTLPLEDIVFAAYALPAKRLAPLLTSKLVPDVQPGTGDDQAFLGTLCCTVRPAAGFPASLLSWTTPGRRFTSRRHPEKPLEREIRLAAYFTYVKREEQQSIYFFRVLVDPPVLGSLAHLLIPSFCPASPGSSRRGFGRSTSISPAQPAPTDAEGFSGQYADRVETNQSIRYQFSAPNGGLEMELHPTSTAAIDAEPGPSDPTATTSFLTLRRFVHFWIRGRYLWKTPVDYRSPVLYDAAPRLLRLPLWQEMGLLSTAEIARPTAAFICPRINVICKLPQPDIPV